MTEGKQAWEEQEIPKEVVESLQALGEKIAEDFPPDWKFAFVVFPLEAGPGVLVSNAPPPALARQLTNILIKMQQPGGAA